MIEDELRAAFARQEELVPDAAALVPAINEATRRRRRTRRVAWSGAGVALAVALATGVPAALSAPREFEVDPLLATAPAAAATGPLTYLVVGLDRRPGAGPGEAAVQADTVIVAHLPADRSALYLITIPRDLRVDIDGHGPGRLTKSYAVGGFAALSREVTDATGLEFDGAATIDFAGLVRVVDRAGGVKVCLDRTFTSIHTNRGYQVGCHRFDGAAALDVLRQRMELPNGPLDRDAHAVRFLRALLSEAADPLTLAKAAGPSLTVDTRGLDLAEVAFEVAKARRSVVGLALTTMDDFRHLGGGEAYFELGPEAPGLFEAIRTDRVGAWVAAHPGLVSS